jgi:hypothetical protein
MKKKANINEVRQLQKIAGLLKEDDLDFSSNPLSGGDTLDIAPLINFIADAAGHISKVQADGEEELYRHEGSLLGWVGDFGEWIDGFYEEEEDLQKFDQIWDAILSKFEAEPEKYNTADDFIDYFIRFVEALKKLKNNRIKSIERAIKLTEDLDLSFNPLGPERKKNIDYVVDKYKSQLIRIFKKRRRDEEDERPLTDLYNLLITIQQEIGLPTENTDFLVELIAGELLDVDYDNEEMINRIKELLVDDED